MGFDRTARISMCALLALFLGGMDANAQGFYPRDWVMGRSGLFYRDYTTPTLDEPGYLYGNASSARSKSTGRLFFAAATVDQYCQQDGSPTVTVLDAPAGSRIATDVGTFRATAFDGGSSRCVGRSVRGTRVYYRGKGGNIVLRVAYPTRGLTYDHVIAVR